MIHEISYSNFATNYFIIICLLAFSYTIGRLFFSKVLKRDSFLEVSNKFIYIAEKILFGITIIIACIALFYTKGLTVQVFSLITIILLSVHTRKYNNTNSASIKLTTIDVLIILITTFLIYIFHYFMYHLPDFVFYGKLSNSLINAQSESVLTLYKTYGVNHILSLYHFGELWLNGFVSHLLHLNSIFTLKNIIYPFFHIITFLLIFGLVFQKTMKLWLAFLFSCALLYGSTILFYPILTPEQGHYTFWFYGLPDITSFKTLIIYPFVILSFYYLHENKIVPFVTILVLVTAHFFTLWIALVGTLILLLMYMFSVKQYKFSIYILVSIFLLLVLSLAPSFLNTENRESIGIKHYIYPISHYFIHASEYLLRFVDYISRPLILYPFVIVGILLGRTSFTKADKVALFTVFFSILSSVLFITFFYSYKESTQALSNILPALMIFATYLCLMNLNHKKQMIFSVFLVVFALLNIYKTYPFSKGKILLSVFEKNLYEFSQQKLQKQNWAYYSEKYWSTYTYNGNIAASPILLAPNTIMPIEVAPVFDTCSVGFYGKNPSYPLQNIHNSVPDLLKYFKKYGITYIYIENTEIVPKDFLKNINPIVTNNSKGIYEVLY